jgi:hypothetical protein
MVETARNAAFLGLALLDVLLGIGALIIGPNYPRARLFLGVLCFLLLIPVVLLGVYALFPVGGLAQPSPASAMSPIEISVSSTQGWQDTQWYVQRGTELVIEVIDGQWTHFKGGTPYNRGEGGYICSPDDAPYSGCAEPLPNFPQGGLIGKVGNQVFGIGQGTTVTVQETGTLYLRMNDGNPNLYGNSDSDEGLSDNDGEIIVRVFSIK